jgi:thiol:disulfide interchange protein
VKRVPEHRAHSKLRALTPLKLLIWCGVSGISFANAAGIAELVTGKPSATQTTPTRANEPLDVNAAFVPRVRFVSASEIEIAFTVAPGHYLYKDKLAVELSADTNAIRPPGRAPKATLTLTKPEGKKVDDATFGKVDVWNQNVAVRARVTGWGNAKATSSKATFPMKGGTVRVISQGCAVEGICFPAQEHTFLLSSPPATFSDATWIAAEPGETSLGFGNRRRAP